MRCSLAYDFIPDNMKRNLQVGLLCALNVASLAVCRGAEPYHFLKEIPVPGDGGWDYLSVVPIGRRLYVSHGTVVAVLDIDQFAVVGPIWNATASTAWPSRRN